MQCDKRRGNISLPIKGPQPQSAHLMWQGWLIGKKRSTRGWFILTELLCKVEMMLPPKNHEISNPAPGVFPKLSGVVWTHFWWFWVHIWAQNWAETRKIRKYLKIRPNKMWWLKCLLIIKNAWDFGYLRDFPREFEWRIKNWHFWKFFLVKLVQLFWAL